MAYKMAQMFGDQPNTGEYDNGIFQHLLGIPYIEHEDDLEPYDVIINTLWLDATISGRNKRIKSRWPDKILIGLSDHPLSTHISKMNSDKQLAYLADVQHCDGLMALTEEERQFYHIAIPSIPVIKMGLPFPFETYTERYDKFKDSKQQYIGLGVGASDNDRNFISSWLVFRRLQLIYPNIKGLFLSLPDNLIPYCSYLADNSTNVFLHQRTTHEDFYDLLSQCSFVINLADRNTPGRLQGEAAFFGVPVVGSERLELQEELFPTMSVSPYQLEDAFNAAAWLIENPDKGKDVAELAYRRLTRYNYRASKIKFNKLLREIEQRRGG